MAASVGHNSSNDWSATQLAAINEWTIERILADPNTASAEGARIEADALQRDVPLVAIEAAHLQARVAYNLDNLDTAVKLWHRAGDHASAAGDPGAQLLMQARWSVALFWLGSAEEAERLLREGLAAARELGDTGVITAYLSRLATVCSALLMVHEAIELHAEFMDLAIAGGQLDEWTTEASNLSLCYLLLHDLDAAKQTCRDALDHIHRTGIGSDNLPYLYQNLATAEEENGELDAAMTHYLAAVEAAVRLHDVHNECMALVEAGRLAWQQGNMQQAQDWFQRVIDLQLANPGTTPELLAQARWGVEATTGRWTAETATELANLIAAGIPAERDMRIFFYDALAESYLGLGDHEAANRVLRESIAFRTDFWNETMQMHAYSSAKALQTREAQRKANEERWRREELDLLLQQVVKLNEENEALIEQLQNRATTLETISREDSLTGLLNRRGFDEHHTQIVDHRSPNRPEHTIILVDVDDFKQVNDTFSHGTGDRVLRQVAQLLRGNTRDSDVVARYGGDEFALLLPSTDQHAAAIVAHRIRREVGDFPWHTITPHLRVTLSIGVWSFRWGDTGDDPLRRVDDLLYQAKLGGKNCVVVAGEGVHLRAIPSRVVPPALVRTGT